MLVGDKYNNFEVEFKCMVSPEQLKELAGQFEQDMTTDATDVTKVLWYGDHGTYHMVYVFDCIDDPDIKPDIEKIIISAIE